jgi:hypothetical protein
MNIQIIKHLYQKEMSLGESTQELRRLGVLATVIKHNLPRSILDNVHTTIELPEKLGDIPPVPTYYRPERIYNRYNVHMNGQPCAPIPDYPCNRY